MCSESDIFGLGIVGAFRAVGVISAHGWVTSGMWSLLLEGNVADNQCKQPLLRPVDKTTIGGDGSPVTSGD